MSGDHNQYQKGTSYLDLSKDGNEIEMVVSRPGGEKHMSRDTGGPAFPTTQYVNGISPSGHNVGMTLRDYFAAKAMQAGYGKHYAMFMDNTYEDWHGDGIKGLVLEAYLIADEMLKAREK